MGAWRPSTTSRAPDPTLRVSDQRAGVYQIGDVYARSCVVIGTSFGIFTLKRLAS